MCKKEFAIQNVEGDWDEGHTVGYGVLLKVVVLFSELNLIAELHTSFSN